MRIPERGNKYIVGWLTLRDGMAAAFDRIAEPYIARCRAEAACRFFDMVCLPGEPLTVLICECFDTEDSHSAHLATPYFKAFWNDLHAIALTGRFENVIAGWVSPDAHDFSAGRRA